MGVRITDEAVAVLKRSLDMAGVDRSAEAGVRLRGARRLGGGSEIQVELAAGPSPGETHVRCEGVNVYVDATVAEMYPDAVVALEPQHETIVVRADAPSVD